jgi:hypothetical protein
MAIKAGAVDCVDETGKNYCIDQALVHASGVLAPALGQRLVIAFEGVNSTVVLAVRLPS